MDNRDLIEKTIDYYDRNAKKFRDDTIDVEFTDIQDMLCKYLNYGDHILDLGCGIGRDSKTFIERGFKVTAMDGSLKLCRMASEYIGQEVHNKRFQELDEENAYDAIWACSSILHLPYNQLKDVFNKMIDSLRTGGYIYASFKYGDFEGERNARYFIDFTEDKFRAFLEEFDELSIVEEMITPDVRKGREDEKWYNVVIKKIG